MKSIYCICENTYKVECKDCEDSIFTHNIGNIKDQGIQVEIDETTTRATSDVSTDTQL